MWLHLSVYKLLLVSLQRRDCAQRRSTPTHLCLDLWWTYLLLMVCRCSAQYLLLLQHLSFSLHLPFSHRLLRAQLSTLSDVGLRSQERG